MQHTLAIDIETYSSNDLAKSGVYKYTEAVDFTILLFAYSFDDNPVHVVDLASGERLPGAVLQALTDPKYLKTAFNANFERTCIAAYLRNEYADTFKYSRDHIATGLSEFMTLYPDQWECTMVKSAMLGLPQSLGMVAKVLGLDEQKADGKALIRYFSIPCKPTKTNGMRSRNLPPPDAVALRLRLDELIHLQLHVVIGSPAFNEYGKEIAEIKTKLGKWLAFIKYCHQDVVTEKAIRSKLSFFQIPDSERKLWSLDQKINDTGIELDPVFIDNAIAIDTVNRQQLTEKAITLTGLDNPNSTAQLKEWLSCEMGSTVDTLRKDDIPVLMKNSDCKNVTQVLEIRQEMSKTSVKKYDAMRKGICSDNRLRGLLQFYGANRTGRWAGHLVQVQNLPKNFLPDLDLARQIVREGDLDSLQFMFGNVPDTLSQLVRTAFVAPAGRTFIVADFSAIEARVIAWLANEKWRLDVFNTHGKIYEASAAQMFKVPISSISFKDGLGHTVKGPNYEMRAKGKVAELALGYQGGPNALLKMGALKMGLTEEELPKLVRMWRNANPAIVRLWQVIGDAATDCVLTGQSVQVMHGVRFSINNGVMFIALPSGRRLAYYDAKVIDGEYGSKLVYAGMDQTTKQWGKQDTYGGKLVENIIQAIARDCLADALTRIDAAGFKVVMHVHDEIVVELPKIWAYDALMEEVWPKITEINKIMSEPIPWAPGLPLTADSYETNYYKKD